VTAEAFDFDWLVIGSGFGGSVSALRLSEKGFRVGVLERGRRYEPADLPASAWQTDKYNWLPQLGKLGIMRTSMFRHVFFPSQATASKPVWNREGPSPWPPMCARSTRATLSHATSQ